MFDVFLLITVTVIGSGSLIFEFGTHPSYYALPGSGIVEFERKDLANR